MDSPATLTKLIRPTRGRSAPFYVLEHKIKISRPWNPSPTTPQPKTIPAIAIWDTGATHTVFDLTLVERLGLTEIDREGVNTAKGPRDAGVYMANVYLSSKIIFDLIRIIDGEVLGGSSGLGHVLIGMDIISQGDFSLRPTRDGKIRMRFQKPPRAQTSQPSPSGNVVPFLTN